LARPKKGKARREPESLAHTLDEIESTGDRLGEWISNNPRPILAVGLAIVLLAAAYAMVTTTQETAREKASAALGRVQSDYRTAMGASPDDTEISEPANPETARRVREEFIERFSEVLEQYPGTVAAALAALDLGTLQEKLGRSDDAVATWLGAVERIGPDAPVGALVELRVAAAYEAEGRWLEAGEAFERAASIEDFPMRLRARAEAARCFAEAGEVDRALAAFARVEADDPNTFLPAHLSARIRELQAAQRLQ
jgi:tetratricopeptide (TPR) repeat protein